MPRPSSKQNALDSTTTSASPHGLQLGPIDKTSFTPLYIQIQAELLRQIHTGAIKFGASLPSEEELSAAFSVSRMTVRQAIRALKDQGYADSHKGLGTFVTEPKVERDAARLRGFSESIRQLGLKPTSRVLEQGTIPATAELAHRLQVAPGTPLICIERLRYVNGQVVGLEESMLVQAQYPGLDRIDFGRHSLFEVLSRRFSIRMGVANEIIEAQPASTKQARLLEVAPRTSLLVITRNLFSTEGKPIEAARSYYRGDRYRAVLEVRSAPDVTNVSG